MKKNGNQIWGLVLISLGIIFGLNALNVTNIDIFFDGWWTLFIIVPCFIGLFKDTDKTGSIIGLLIGILFLLGSQDFINFDIIWKLLLPIILIIIGISVAFKDSLHGKVKQEMSKLNKNTDKSYCATFGSQNVNYDNEDFSGCELNAIFGGVKLDLREAKIKKDVIITSTSVFGGIDILVPSDIKVKVTSTPIFGGVDNKHKVSKEEKVKTIYVNATCIFGGVEIK